MPNASPIQSSFLGGEWAPTAQGAIEDPNYVTGMNRCLNAIPVEEQACVRRSGTQYAGHTRNGSHASVLTFEYEASAPYNLEFTDGHIRFWSGADLVTGSDAVSVLSISSTNPAVLTTTTAVTWTTADQVRFSFLTKETALACVLLAQRQFSLVKISTTTFILQDALTGTALDATALTWAATYNARVERVTDLVSPYTGVLFETVRPIQSEKLMLLVQATIPPRVVIATPSTSWFASFAISTADFQDGPYLDPVNGLSTTTGHTVTPSGTSGSINLTISSIAAINAGQGFLSTDVNRLIRLFSAGTTWTWARITSITSTTVAVATVLGVNLASTAAMFVWRMGLYSDTTGYPTCGCYADGRIWLGGAVDNRFDTSMSNGVNFATGAVLFSPSGTTGTVADNNAISYTFNAKDLNKIGWMEPSDNGVIAGTLKGEWAIQRSTATGVLSPTNVDANQVTQYGSAAINPVRTGLTTVFVQKFKRKLLEFLTDAQVNKYFAPNLSRYAKHLTQTGIEQLAYQEELAPIVWMRTAAGKLVGTTYKRIRLYSTEPPLFNGWHRHTLGTGRSVISLCVKPTEDGLLQNLVMVTQGDTNGTHHIELMRNLFQDDEALTAAWFLDGAVVPSAAASVTVSGAPGLRLYGLWHLDGQTVTAFIAGLDCGEHLVTNGYMDIPYGSDPDGFFTAAHLSNTTTAGIDYDDLAVDVDAGMLRVPMVVGLGFTTQGQLLRPILPAKTGAATGPALGKTRRQSQYAALLSNVVKVKFGTVFGKLRPALFKKPGGTAYLATELYSGVHHDTLNDDPSFDSMMCWEVTRPFPATVLALEGFIQTQDRT